MRSKTGSKTEIRRAALLLAIAAAIPFLPVLHNGFTNWDDPVYVTMNPHVRSGLTLEALRWAFTTTEASNWHPLTWISHQLDATLFGTRAWGHHATSLLVHATSVALLFVTLAGATGAPGRSAVAALLFGIHPLRVESVAWASERKDVLSTFFWILGMLAWVRWCRRPLPRRYALVLAALAAGLLAKPMLVTFPLALVLFDLWPLGRGDDRGGSIVVPPRRLFVEKAPLFALVAASAAVTLWVQRSAMPTGQAYPLSERLPNAIVSYGVYLGQTLWPTALSPFYPHPGPTLPAWQIAAALAIVAGLTALAFRLRTRAPYVGFGWLWYMGTLVPVIGIVQVGSHAMADRYTYVPSIGLVVIVAWGGWDLLRAALVRDARGLATAKRVGVALVVAASIGLGTPTWLQTARWRDAITLFRHALDLDPNNPLAHNNLGTALEADGRTDEAIAHYREALRVSPRHTDARGNLAMALSRRGDLEEAERGLRAFLEDRPEEATALNELAWILVGRGRASESIPLLETAVRVAPEYAEAHYNLSRALAAVGRTDDAREHARRAEQLGYREPDLYAHVAWLAIGSGRFEEARVALETLIRLRPDYAPAHRNLGVVYERLDRFEEARREMERARALAGDAP